MALHLHGRINGLLKRAANASLAAATVVDSWDAVYRYRTHHGRWPSVVRPRTFNEKLIYKRLMDRRPYLTQTADKYAVRDFVAGRIGEQHLSDLYAVVDTPDQLDVSALPSSFVVKPTHGTKCVALVPDKDHLDLDTLKTDASRWLDRRWPVWNRRIPPRLVVEEYLGDERGRPPSDYRLFVMNGEVPMIAVDAKASGTIVRSLYTSAWERLDATYGRPAGPDLPPPRQLTEMLQIATTLAEGTDFVRVDLYEVDNRIVFGELTHSPAAGGQTFAPLSFDLWLGSQWKQPRRYRSPQLIERVGAE